MDRKQRKEIVDLIHETLKTYFDDLPAIKERVNAYYTCSPGEALAIGKALHKGIEIGINLASEKPKNHLKPWHPSEEAFLENRFDKFVNEMAKHFNRTENAIAYKVAKIIKDSGIKV